MTPLCHAQFITKHGPTQEAESKNKEMILSAPASKKFCYYFKILQTTLENFVIAQSCQGKRAGWV